MKSIVIEGMSISELCLGMSMFGEYCPFMNLKHKGVKDCKGTNCKTRDDIYDCIIKNGFVKEVE